jgi:predicted nucleic acid-binding protein
VDTSGFFALVNEKDPYHADVDAVLRRAAATRARVVTTNFVLAETHALLLSRLGRRIAVRFLQGLLAGTVSIERVTSADEAKALQIIVEYEDKDFSYTDASSFAVMRRCGVEVALRSDRHFLQFGFRQARA